MEVKGDLKTIGRKRRVLSVRCHHIRHNVPVPGVGTVEVTISKEIVPTAERGKLEMVELKGRLRVITASAMVTTKIIVSTFIPS